MDLEGDGVSLSSLEQVFRFSVDFRSELIAYQFCHSLSNYGRLLAARALGYTHKRWVSYRGTGSSPCQHAALDGRTVGREETFYHLEGRWQAPNVGERDFDCRCTINLETIGKSPTR